VLYCYLSPSRFAGSDFSAVHSATYKLQRFQQPFFSALSREVRRADKSRIAPTVATNNTIPGPPSGTVGIRSLSVSLFPFPISWSAYARAGRIKVAATKAKTLLLACPFTEAHLLIRPC
jgi:hypothetical protein